MAREIHGGIMNNTVVLIGRITEELEIKETKNKKKMLRFRLAVNRNYKNAEGEYEANFIPIVTFEKLAELLKDHCKKGDLLGVKGQLETNTYTNDKNEKIYSWDVQVNEIQFLQPKPKEETQPATQPESNPFEEFGKEINQNTDDDLPF